MKERTFTFWKGDMPEYIKLCMKTWGIDYIVLNFENLSEYTNIPMKNINKFTLPQIADVVRVHVLRDQGGYWLDTDTILTTNELPKENMIGHPNTRANTIGYLHTKPNTDMYIKWAEYQDAILKKPIVINNWSIMGNDFTDSYVKEHKEISICSVRNCWAETYMITDNITRSEKYRKFYFTRSYQLSDLKPTNMLMLHNSWTPNHIKGLSEDELRHLDCTLSNILNELVPV